MTPEQIIGRSVCGRHFGITENSPASELAIGQEGAVVMEALREAGWSLHRLDDYGRIAQGAWRCRSCGEDCRQGEPCPEADYDDRTYALVPVESDSPEGGA